MAMSSVASPRCLASAAGPLTSNAITCNARNVHAGPLLPSRRSSCRQGLHRAGASSVFFNLPKSQQTSRFAVDSSKQQRAVQCAVHQELSVNLEERKGGNRAGTGSAVQEPGSHPGDAYFAKDKRPIILFDGVCNLCNGGVNFMLDHDPKGNLRFSALQSDAGRALLRRANRDPQDITSIVLVEPNNCYIRSEAILHIAQYLHQPLSAFGKLGLLVPGFFRDTFYNLIAYNRYSIMGKRQMCRIGDGRFTDRFVS